MSHARLWPHTGRVMVVGEPGKASLLYVMSAAIDSVMIIDSGGY